MTINEAKQIHGDLPVYYGTGYPIHEPHILVINRLPDPHFWVYPQGDNGLQGMRLNPNDPCYRKAFYYHLTESQETIMDINLSAKAIEHVLRRIRDHEYIGYYMGDFTESFELLTAAYANIHQLPLEIVIEQFRPRHPRNPREENKP